MVLSRSSSELRESLARRRCSDSSTLTLRRSFSRTPWMREAMNWEVRMADGERQNTSGP